jgi:hypothetical protein
VKVKVHNECLKSWSCDVCNVCEHKKMVEVFLETEDLSVFVCIPCLRDFRKTIDSLNILTLTGEDTQ